MADDIFIIQDDGTLIEMNEQAYDSEELLQRLLADYPSLLAGGQVDVVSPRRWLLVKREMGIPGEEAGGGRWSLDHLFLDQDGIPTLVEVKRSTDTRLRREVVGQMLDYAANAVVYWPVERIREEFKVSNQDADERLLELLGEDGNLEKFWEQVKTNLQAKRIRMLFVADVIPPELRRIGEFLNEITDPTEVLAVEIKHYVGQGLKTLVPRVIGQTEKRPPRSPGRNRIDEEARLAFWTAFHDKVTKEAPHLRPEPPSGESRLALPVDVPGMTLYVVADGNARMLAVRLTIRRPSDASTRADDITRRLDDNRGAFSNDWRCKISGRGHVKINVATTYSMNMADEQAWPEYHQWLLDAVRELYNKVLPVIR